MMLIALFAVSANAGGDCKKAIEYYNEGVKETDLTIKEAKFLLALNESCDNPEVTAKIFNNLADTYESRGELTRAIEFYNKSIMAKKDYAKPYFGIADIMFKLEDFYSAYIMYKKGLEIEPDDELSQKNIKEAEKGFKGHMRVYFDTGSTVVSDDYLFRLDLMAEIMKGSVGSEFTVSGYTDNVGSFQSNLTLSKKRAEWVKEYFVGKGIDSKRLEIEFLGEEKPLVSNDDEDGRTLNRRVEIRVVK